MKNNLIFFKFVLEIKTDFTERIVFKQVLYMVFKYKYVEVYFGRSGNQTFLFLVETRHWGFGVTRLYPKQLPLLPVRGYYSTGCSRDD